MKATRVTSRPEFQVAEVSGTVTAAITPERAPARMKAVIEVEPMRMPCRRAAIGLIALARIARPRSVKRKRETITARQISVAPQM